MATRNQRRKAVRARKAERAKLLEQRALRVLAEERAKRNLANPHKPSRSKALASSAPSYMEGYSARGANGQRLATGFSVLSRKRKRGSVRKIVGRTQFDESQIVDVLSLAGQEISAQRVRSDYAGTLARCGLPKGLKKVKEGA